MSITFHHFAIERHQLQDPMLHSLAIITTYFLTIGGLISIVSITAVRIPVSLGW
jgi:hypothetical protein